MIGSVLFHFQSGPYIFWIFAICAFVSLLNADLIAAYVFGLVVNRRVNTDFKPKFIESISHLFICLWRNPIHLHRI